MPDLVQPSQYDASGAAAPRTNGFSVPTVTPQVQTDLRDIPRVRTNGYEMQTEAAQKVASIFGSVADSQAQQQQVIQQKQQKVQDWTALSDLAQSANGDIGTFRDSLEAYKAKNNFDDLRSADFDERALSFGKQVQDLGQKRIDEQKQYNVLQAVDDFTRQVPSQASSLIHSAVPSDFDGNVNKVMGIEGGYTANDAGRGATNYGINQTANPDVDVKNLTPDGAKQIYKTRYWDAIGADQLPENMRGIAFDAAVNQGVGATKSMLSQAGNDPTKFAQLRAQRYNDAVQNDTEGRFTNSDVKSWQNRLDSFKSFDSGQAIDVASQGVLGRFADTQEQIMQSDMSAPAKLALMDKMKTAVVQGGLQTAFANSSDKAGFLKSFDDGTLSIPMVQSDGSVKSSPANQLMDIQDQEKTRNTFQAEINREAAEANKQAKAQQSFNLGKSLYSGLNLLDPADKEHQKGLDTYFDQAYAPTLQGLSQADKTQSLISFVDRSKGYIPSSLKQTIEGGVASGNAEVAANASNLLSTIQDHNSYAGEINGISKPILSRANDMNNLMAAGVDAQTAYDRVEKKYSTDLSMIQPQIKENFEAQKKAGNVDVNDAIKAGSSFWANHVPWNSNTPTDPATMARAQKAYEDIYKSWLDVSNDPDSAKQNAIKEFNNNWGPSNVNGSQEFMELPPERTAALAGKDLPTDWAHHQMLTDVKGVQGANYGGQPLDLTKLPDENIRVTPNVFTSRTGKYQVQVKSTDGNWDVVAQPDPATGQMHFLTWSPDPNTAAHNLLKADNLDFNVRNFDAFTQSYYNRGDVEGLNSLKSLAEQHPDQIEPFRLNNVNQRIDALNKRGK